MLRKPPCAATQASQSTPSWSASSPARVPGDIMARLAWEGAAPDDQLLGAVKGAWSGVEVQNLFGGVEVVGE